MRFPGNVVSKDDTRCEGAGTPDKCFYCSGKFGGAHDADCVCLDKPIKVRLTLDLVMVAVRSWDKAKIEFRLNESSYCADNVLGDIERHCSDGRCLCGRAHFEMLGDATLEEAAEVGLKPNVDDGAAA